MKSSEIACLIPSVTGSERVLGTLFAVVNQSVAPLRILLGDSSEIGLQAIDVVRRFCRIARIDVIRLPVGTNAHVARFTLAREAFGADLFWHVDDDIWPRFDCLEKLQATMREYEAIAVVGAKRETIRKNPYDGKDWNAAGDAMRLQRVSWADTANLLVDADVMFLGLQEADNAYAKFDQVTTGEDVLCSARFANEGLCLAQPAAVAYHFPTGPERWEGLPESDEAVLQALAKVVSPSHLEWLRRGLDQSDW